MPTNPDDTKGFIQSGELPTDRAPAVLNRAYCKGWHDAITNVIQHLQSQMGVWRDGDIALEHLFKHLQGNVRSLQIDPPPSLFEADQRLVDAIELLEVCCGCDLIYDAWMAFGEGKVVHGVKIGPTTTVADLVDAFLKRHTDTEGKE